MTKLEELKDVFAAATQGEWKIEEYRAMAGRVARVYVKGHGDLVSGNFMYDDAHLIALMHNALPALIECAEAMLALGDAFDIGQRAGDTSAIGKYRKALAKLKEPS